MYQIKTLKNGLTLITINLPHLDSVTTLIAVGAGSRYETKVNNGISHFLEHMFFKGSKKYPSAEIIATTIDSVGAINNAATSKEFTYYWIKSAANHLELACDVLSSQLKEPLFESEEIEREKGVIIEELRMFRDMPQKYVWDLYERLQFGDQPLGWDIGGTEKRILSFNRQTFVDYINQFYAPENMALIFAGKLPKNIDQVAEKYFLDLPKRATHPYVAYKVNSQVKPRVNVFHKKTDQASVVFGVEGYDRYDEQRFAAEVLGTILGQGMSSRLFIQVRERRGLAYHVVADADVYKDTGVFVSYAGLKIEKIEEGIKVIRDEFEKMGKAVVKDDEMKKAKEIIKGRLAIRSESTNFLAEHFGVQFVLDRRLESFDEYLAKIEKVNAEDVKKCAQELFKPERYNLQVIGPFEDPQKFTSLLVS